MSSPISNGITFRELNVSFVLPMVEQLVLEIVDNVLVDQAVKEEDQEPFLCNWDTNYDYWGVPAVPVPLLPSAPDFSMGRVADEWESARHLPVLRPKIYQCHMAECLVLGRGCADYLYNLVKHFTKFHPEIEKNSALYPKQSNFVRFLVIQDSPNSTPPLCISPEVRFKSFIITVGSE